MTIGLLYFTRRVSIVTAVRFVIVDFKEMNELNEYQSIGLQVIKHGLNT